MNRRINKRTGGGLPDDGIRRYARFMVLPLAAVVLLVLVRLLDPAPAGEAPAESAGQTAAETAAETLEAEGTGAETDAPEAAAESKAAAPLSESYDPSAYELQQDAVPELLALVQSYCEAKEDCDPVQLARVFGVDSMTEEEEAAQREKMELVEASVKGYENISCYSIEGPEPDSYVIFPYFEIRFRETDVRMPQLTWGYARKGADGQYYIEAKADEEIQACIALAGQQEDAARLIKQVKQQQQAAVESDAYLQEIYGGAAASEVVIEGKQE